VAKSSAVVSLLDLAEEFPGVFFIEILPILHNTLFEAQRSNLNVRAFTCRHVLFKCLGADHQLIALVVAIHCGRLAGVPLVRVVDLIYGITTAKLQDFLGQGPIATFRATLVS